MQKKLKRRDDLANIEVPCLGDFRQIHVRMGFPLFVQKVLQNVFGIDPDEFLPERAIEAVDIGRRMRRLIARRWLFQTSLPHASCAGRFPPGNTH